MFSKSTVSIIGLALLATACSPQSSTAPATPSAANTAQQPSGGDRRPMSDTATISGSSTHTSEREKCYTDNDPPAPQFYYSTWVSGSSVVSQEIDSTAPNSSSAVFSVSLTTSGGAAAVSIVNPSGTVVASTTIAGNSSGTLSYWDPSAQSGRWHVNVSGTVVDNGGDCGGIVISGPTTYTDTTYSGTVTYPGAVRFPLGGTKKL
jgi:hypothetical protein